MKNLILGTAGHIDHGKTSLVKALTGIDTDRLKEEQARGITIELGFAHLELAGGIHFGIVDVPGHEKFVRTMVAGVGGMDIVMLVIAADEGIMPQTREHLDILRLLGAKSGLVALTKQDMVDKEWLALVTEEIREFVTDSFLENAPILPVSSRSGDGVEQLKSELTKIALTIDEKRRDGYFRLPVDRVFTMIGFGTVVTGTLLSGEIKVGDEIELLPTGQTGRVRGIQAHGNKVELGLAGQRLAINIQGVDLNQVKRGDVVVPSAFFSTTNRVDVRLDYLPSALRALKHRATLRLHSATYEVSAQLILLDRDSLLPGESAFAQLRLKVPALLLPGDSYILRTASPATTVAGGVILDPAPPCRRRRGEDALKLLQLIGGEEHQQIIAALVKQSLLSGITAAELLLRSGVARKAFDLALSTLLAAGEIIQVAREPRILISNEAFETLKSALLKEVTVFMKANPLKTGIGKEELKTRLPKRSDQRYFTPLLAAMEREGLLQSDRDIVKLAGAAAEPLLKDERLGEKIFNFIAEKELEPPTTKEIMERFNIDEKSLRDNLALLVRVGKLACISNELFYDVAALIRLREKLVELLKEKGEITPPDYRETTGLSRKYLIPLLEYFDGEKLTIRVGDKRVLRKR